MLQVVAGSIMAAVLLVEANVRAVVEAAVGCAAGQVGNDIQKARGYQVIVAECCEKINTSSVKVLKIYGKISTLIIVRNVH